MLDEGYIVARLVEHDCIILGDLELAGLEEQAPCFSEVSTVLAQC